MAADITQNTAVGLPLEEPLRPARDIQPVRPQTYHLQHAADLAALDQLRAGATRGVGSPHGHLLTGRDTPRAPDARARLRGGRPSPSRAGHRRARSDAGAATQPCGPLGTRDDSAEGDVPLTGRALRDGAGPGGRPPALPGGPTQRESWFLRHIR